MDLGFVCLVIVQFENPKLGQMISVPFEFIISLVLLYASKFKQLETITKSSSCFTASSTVVLNANDWRLLFVTKVY